MAPIKDFHESSAPSNTLWVGNLAADVSDTDLMCLFAKFGALDCMTSYSSRNYAFVYFKRVEDAAAAKDTLQATLVRGNSLKIEFARPARPCKLLWVGGISPAVSKEQLREEFLKFGKIEDFVFNRERSSASIEFLTIDGACEAMRNMKGKKMGGDQIWVDFLPSHTLRRPSGGRKEGLPSKVLWVGYPPSVQIDEQMLHNAMILFGEIERITSFPSRHYSFVEFRSVDEARRAKEGLQGRLFNEPRISIMYSSSGLSSFHPGMRGPNEHVFGSNQLEMLDHPRPMGRNTLSGPIPPSSIHRPNLPAQPFGSEFDDLAPMRSLRDENSNISWKRPSSPGAGILSPVSRIKPPVTGRDVLDPNQHQREPKRSRIDYGSPIDDEFFPTRKIDNRGLSSDRTYRFPLVTDADNSGQTTRGLSPVGVRATVRSSQHRAGNDYVWRGMIAKGGTPVCHARCVPFGKGTKIELPEVVNCSARTGLDMLAKHYSQAIGFDVVYFLPDSEEDFASYTEFLHYLGSKNRAGVAKFDDGTTLFLVPPSDFLMDVLNVKGPERLYGVVLKLPQVPTCASVEPYLQQTSHFPRCISVPSKQADDNQISRKEDLMPRSYNSVCHEETKPVSKLSYPPMAEFTTVEQPSNHQDLPKNNSAIVSQAGVSELIATIASFLPANAQSAVVEGGQQIHGSYVRPPPFSPFVADNGTSHGWKQSGNPSHVQYGSQLNSQSQVHSPYQPYPPIPNAASNSSENTTPPKGTQMQDSPVNIPIPGVMQSQPLVSVAMTSRSGQVPMLSQLAMSQQVSQQYPLELAHQKGNGGISHDSGVVYSPSVNPRILSSQTQGGIHSHTQPAMLSPADKVNWDIPNQVQQFQTGSVQGSSEAEVDKNQRYQSTLQFAASLLLQIQQKQQQQTVQGSGNQQ